MLNAEELRAYRAHRDLPENMALRCPACASPLWFPVVEAGTWSHEVSQCAACGRVGVRERTDFEVVDAIRRLCLAASR